MKDHAKPDRQALIAGKMTHEEKIRRAKNILGERYLCHPANHVKKAPHRMQEITRADVERTAQRYVKRTGLDLV